jgi:hypothetical protein
MLGRLEGLRTGGLDQMLGEGDPLDLMGVEHRIGRAAPEYEFPGRIDGIAGRRYSCPARRMYAASPSRDPTSLSENAARPGDEHDRRQTRLVFSISISQFSMTRLLISPNLSRVGPTARSPAVARVHGSIGCLPIAFTWFRFSAPLAPCSSD